MTPTAKLGWDEQRVISETISVGRKILGRLKGRSENIGPEDYDAMEALLDSLPLDMDPEEHRRLKACVINARNASGGEAAFEIRQVTRRLQHSRGAGL